MAERIYTYFLYPEDSHTNEVMSKYVDKENFSSEVRCADGKTRSLWECPSGLVFALWRSRDDLKIRFIIFIRQGKNGKIRDCTFLYKKEGGGGRKKKKKKIRNPVGFPI